MKPIRIFTVIPKLPVALSRLRELAYNVWWTWDRDALELFQRLDRDLWEESEHNPVRMLGMVSQELLESRAVDDGYLAHYDRVCERLDRYLTDSLWYDKTYGSDTSVRIAYFSAEFGLTECLPIYSGGLGILAGDHLKAASDLGLPLAGVGLLYQQGYFRQYLNRDGWQGESYPVNDFYAMPVEPVCKDDRQLCVGVPFPGRTVTARIWRVNVGRIHLYLLDTNCPENTPDDRTITGELYGGDQEMRIRQEIVLGIGGMRALRALGLNPGVFHMNEGHSAFLALERVRRAMEDDGLTFDEAVEATRASNIFTTHTPVPAGIDIFPPDMVRRYLGETAAELGLDWNTFFALGSTGEHGKASAFSMANLAFHFSSYANGVSKLHGAVSRNMWRHIWPGVPEHEIPIDSVTNGIHLRSWVSKDMGTLYERYLGQNWTLRPENQEIWTRATQIPAEELWRTHERRRERLVSFARERLVGQLIHRGAAARELDMVADALNPEALTIGFARRFATYKRADLLLRDPDRLHRILAGDPDRPVQIIFSGKAHPKDQPGKELIRELLHIARQERFRRHIVFLENYNMTISRYMVQGVDVWLNTPRRLYEASGTSGMKAAANGVLNMSILDGWWDEAYATGLGWAIGKGEEYEDLEYQYDVESSAIYDLLEQEVVPLFYDRDRGNIPRGWVDMMRRSLRDLCPVFNTARMVTEYTSRFYAPALDRHKRFTESGNALAQEFARWKNRVLELWPAVKATKVSWDGDGTVHVGEQRPIRVTTDLGGLDPEEVHVQVYEGPLSSNGTIGEGRAISLVPTGSGDGSSYVFEGTLAPRVSGQRGLAVRLMPRHPDLPNLFDLKAVTWVEAGE